MKFVQRPYHAEAHPENDKDKAVLVNAFPHLKGQFDHVCVPGTILDMEHAIFSGTLRALFSTVKNKP